MYSSVHRLIYLLSVCILLSGCGKEQTGSQLANPKLESTSNIQVDHSQHDAEGSALHDQKNDSAHLSISPVEPQADLLKGSAPATFSPPPKPLTIKIQ